MSLLVGTVLGGLVVRIGRIEWGGFAGSGDALAAGGTANSDARMIAVTGDVGSGTSVLWLIDTETKRIAVYRSRLGKNIEWVAARNANWDFMVEGYHDESALPAEEMKRRWEQHALRKPVEDPTPPEKSAGGNSAKPDGAGDR